MGEGAASFHEGAEVKYTAQVGIIYCFGECPPRIEITYDKKWKAILAARYYAMLLDWLWIIPPFTFHTMFSKYRLNPVPSDYGIYYRVRGHE